MDLKGSVMPLAGRDLINQDSRGTRSYLINLRFKTDAWNRWQLAKTKGRTDKYTLFTYYFLMFLFISGFISVCDQSFKRYL